MTKATLKGAIQMCMTDLSTSKKRQAFQEAEKAVLEAFLAERAATHAKKAEQPQNSRIRRYKWQYQNSSPSGCGM